MSSWWQETTVYQVYPRSFFDSDNDGIGDLRGLISKLDYIKETGFETLWISPFFAGPQRDFGYDISDYCSIAPEFGTVDDVRELIAEIHSRGMYVIFDMVLNHTSDQHQWFAESRSSTDNPKRDWYIWKDGRPARLSLFRSAPQGHGPQKNKTRPPNNWKSQVSGSGWHHDPKTDQWYWAAFLPFQPDLNYRNPELKAEIFRMLRYWLNEGVDGFRLDIIGSIFEDEQFRDSPFIWKLLPDENNTGMLFRSTCRTQNLPESIAFCGELREITDSFRNPPRFMVGETFGSPEEVARFCRGGLHTAFAFKCTDTPFTARAFRDLIAEYEGCFAPPLLPVWAFSNHDRTRRISALGGDHQKAKLNAAFQLTVRGIPFFYYGEETGMTDTPLPHRASLDPVSFPFKRLPAFLFNLINRKIHGSLNRDRVRTPMQWDATENAGFCAAGVSPWLPLNSDYKKVNVKAGLHEADSLLNCVKRFLKFRAESRPLKCGSLSLLEPERLPADITGYRRSLTGHPSLTVLLNFGSASAAAAVDAACVLRISTRGGRAPGFYCAGESVILEGFECIVLEDKESDTFGI